jgi:dihydroorotate dehydrogenase
MLWRALRSLLFRFDPERIHHLAVVALRALGWRPVARAVRPRRRRPSLEVEALGLRFEHPLGLAAGFDKGEGVAPGLLALGFSHVEIGTITPRPQAGNPRPRLFRLPEHRAIVNRMGFNNDGAEACAARLARLHAAGRAGVIGVNVGKNKDTPNERAESDYLACIDRLHTYADYLVVNISSPNTPGLRQLQEPEALRRLLSACAARAAALDRPKPLLVKLAPDLEPEALDDAVDVALAVGAAGIIATNTTVQRPGEVAAHRRARETGGLSGAPLEPLATRALRRVYARAGGRLPIVGVGGVMSAWDAYAKVRAGASLVQAYTGFIYGGPSFVSDVVGGLEKLVQKDGFSRLSDAVGADVHRDRAASWS